jgi:poly(A) polymerase/tRNA nucleotidyltransferase (CCA-adding enzyme)
MDVLIPLEVRQIALLLLQRGFSACLVGGCVRDLLRGVAPHDWDIATNAVPEQIQDIFPDSVYENIFGTVGVKTRSIDPAVAIVEVTTFRTESAYSDGRHPDSVSFVSSIERDLSRRDFTVNAMAIDMSFVMNGTSSLTLSDLTASVIDPYGGFHDLNQRCIRAVGDPTARFREDGLRMMRAVRFSAYLDFPIEEHTFRAITQQSELLSSIARERIRDELTKMIMTPRGDRAVCLLEDLGLLKFVLPELREGIGCGQNKHHVYTVFEHNIRALGYAVSQNYSLVVRMASLLHDVGKPRSKRGEGPDSTFYNHDAIGATMTVALLNRLHFSRDFVSRVSHLVRHHLFYYNVGEVTEAGVRRFIARVGEDCIDDLFKVREADRIGSGVPKAIPYKTRHLQFMIDKVRRDPISVKMLAIDGADVMRILSIAPSVRIGTILSILLEEVLDDPTLNTVEHLTSRVLALGRVSDEQLSQLSSRAKQKVFEAESGAEADMKKKHFIR